MATAVAIPRVNVIKAEKAPALRHPVVSSASSITSGNITQLISTPPAIPAATAIAQRYGPKAGQSEGYSPMPSAPNSASGIGAR